jgi:GT2 family glycosyltransferase
VRLSAIVVAFGKRALLGRCLETLADALATFGGESELIVVANDGAVRRVPGAVVVRGAPELGFAGGVAAGLAAARGEWVALVNDDCLVATDALAELLAAGETDERVGSVAAQVLFAGTGTVNSAGLEVDELGVARERCVGRPAFAAPDGPAAAVPVEVFGASAACALYRRAMLDELGGFDPSFFAYLEDADLAWRARMAGWRCLLAPAAVAYHHHSATLGHGSASKHRLVGRNRVRMLAKNASGAQLRHGLLRIVAYDLAYAGYVAATARTLAPLTGRVRALGEWTAYREAGSATRRELSLSRAPGWLAALARNRVYTAGGES